MNFLIILCCARLLAASPIRNPDIAGPVPGPPSVVTSSTETPPLETFAVKAPDSSVTTPSKDLADAMIVTEDTWVTDLPVVEWKGLYIKKPCQLTVRDVGLIAVSEEMNNDGTFFVSSGDSSSVLRVMTKRLANYGTWVFDALKNGEWSSAYIQSIDSFINAGKLLLFAHDSGFNAAFEVLGAKFSNKGVISAYRPQSDVTGDLELVSLSSPPVIDNSGTICLHNFYSKQRASMLGQGCVSIHKGSTLTLQGTAEMNAFYWDINQRVAIFDNSTLHLTGVVGTTKPIQFRLHHFGQGSRIKFAAPITQKNFKYIETSGFIIFSNINMRVTISIGLGYDVRLFVVDEENSTLTYAGPPPNEEVPSECVCDFSVPENGHDSPH